MDWLPFRWVPLARARARARPCRHLRRATCTLLRWSTPCRMYHVRATHHASPGKMDKMVNPQPCPCATSIMQLCNTPVPQQTRQRTPDTRPTRIISACSAPTDRLLTPARPRPAPACVPHVGSGRPNANGSAVLLLSSLGNGATHGGYGWFR